MFPVVRVRYLNWRGFLYFTPFIAFPFPRYYVANPIVTSEISHYSSGMVLTERQLTLPGLPRPTQRQRVLAQLKAEPTCGTEFLEMHIPRYGGRILELRKDGHAITNEPCWKHQHYSRQTIYRLA